MFFYWLDPCLPGLMLKFLFSLKGLSVKNFDGMADIF
uniref:Uncharacterized protein n=1 Tax=Rhizophora mucronata TaxID=61149 RepID=A0A2P2LXH2_RHIMU